METDQRPSRLLSPHQAALLEALRRQRSQARRPARLTRRAGADRAPMSFAQRRLWYLDQTTPGGGTYLLPMAHRLAGPVDVPALAWALNAAVTRHDSLRTTFAMEHAGEAAQPLQIVGADLRVELPVIDLAGLPVNQRAPYLDARLDAEFHTSMDLATGPLLRARLVRYSATEHVLLLTMHHIVADEWSLEVFNRELAELYEARASGRAPSLPELSIRYADFAVWQHEWLASPQARLQLAYWRDRLWGAPAVLDLPTTYPRPEVPSDAGATHRVPLGISTVRLRGLCQRLEATPYMVLLATFQVVLSRYTSGTDIVVGAPAANRGRSELEGMVGFFTNTLPIRTDLSGNPSFGEIVARVREATLGAHTHQDLPLEKLVEVLRPERRPGFSPLIQVMFLYSDESTNQLNLPGLAVTPIEVPSHTAKFDLTLAVSDRSDGLTATIEYRTELFDEAAMRRFVGHFETVLDSVLADPDLSVATVNMLTARELDRVLVHWNEAPAGDGGGLLHTDFRDQARSTPDEVAVMDEHGTLSYWELDERTDALAGVLRSLGVRRGSLVGICLERGVGLAVAILAVLKAGGAYLPLDPAYPVKRLRFLTADAGAMLLLTQASLRERLPDHPIVVELDRAGRADPQAVPGAIASQTSQLSGQAAQGEDDLAYVIYTSGSTGQPKGVMVTHRGAVNYTRWARRAYQLGPGDAVPVHSSIAFDLTVTSLFVPLLAGATVDMLAEATSPAALGEALRERRTPYRLIKITPAHLEIVTRQLDPDEASRATHAFIIGGESLHAEQLAFWRRHAPGIRLINEYGPTETVVGCTAYEVDGKAALAGPVPIGRPIANTQLYLLDRHLNPVPVGVVGELYVGGRGVARGYLGRPDLTAEGFLPNPFGDGDRLYRTGDLARYRADGVLEYLGRRDSQVKLHGFRIEPGEVEAAIARQPGVAQAAVAVRDVRPGDRRLVGYVVTAPVAGSDPGGPAITGGSAETAATDAAALRDRLRAELPDHLVPSRFVFLAAIPLTPNGKVDRAALPEPADVPVAQVDPARPTSPGDQPIGAGLEERIAEIWRTLLGVAAVGRHDNFFDLGGHSLLLLQLHQRLRELVGERVTVTDLFRHPTVHALSRFLGRDGVVAAGGPARVAAGAGEPAATPAVRAATGSARPAVAIVGMACRFPDASTPEQFWRNIHDGLEAVRSLTDSEILSDGEDPVLLADPNYVKAGAVLSDIDQFDADLFGLTAREAEILDPQQRLFLECSWEALERAGYDGESFRGRIGVYAGSGRSSYLTENLLAAPELVRSVGEYQLSLSTDKDFLATRLAYKLNLRGPSISVNTACSTSLVAVHLACRSLLAGECDLVLAGGVSVAAAQRRGYLYRAGDIASPDGHCRAFDADAQGTIGASGAGVVVLKRLDDAIADGDTIHAVIRGSAVNNDGSQKVGFTAPGVDGQAEVITAAIEAAGVEPRTIGYLEAHGTGTALGDPIEMAALTQAFRRHTVDSSFCAVGSVKSNIGHTDAAAGVAGLIKAVMAVQHGTLPATLNVRTPNPAIDFATSPFYVNTETRPWPAQTHPRRAGVSSFGIGGTNAHAIIEQAPHLPQVTSQRSAGRTTPGAHLLVLSAKTGAALDVATARLAEHLRQRPDVDLADVAATLQCGRRQLTHRRILVGRDQPDAVEALAGADRRRLFSGAPAVTGRMVAFAIPGQGAQYAGMGAGLYRRLDDYRSTVDECSAILQPMLGLDLRDLLYPAQGISERAQSMLTQTRLAQPALFVTEYALAQVLLAADITPTGMAGHSIGEYVAACLAGVFPVEDALRLVAARGRLMQDLPAGAMLAVWMSESDAQALLDTAAAGEAAGVSIAAVNAPELCVLSGPPAAVLAVQHVLAEQGIGSRMLHTSHAFHSAMMDPVLPAFGDELSRVSLRRPHRPFVSNVTGTWITTEEATSTDYWVRHLRQPVRFGQCAETLLGTGAVVLEIGPGRTLTTIVRQLAGDAGDAAGLMRPASGAGEDLAVLLEGIGRAWLAGAAVDWTAFATADVGGAGRHRRVPLPTYPFQRRRYWVTAPRRAVAVAAGAPDAPVAYGLPVPAAPGPGTSTADTRSIVDTGLASVHARPALATEYVAPRTEAEAAVASVWRDLFGIAQVGVFDDFFELGGHSLLATQLLARLRAQCGAELALEAVFDAPTVAAQVAMLTQQGQLRTTTARTGAVAAVPAPAPTASAAALTEAAPAPTEPVPAPTRPVAVADGQGGPIPAAAGLAGPLPLSSGQRRLWFLDLAHPGSAAYIIATAVRLDGDLDAAALRAALTEIVRRHESLRTTFPAPEGEPLQVVHPAGPVDLPVVEIKCESPAARGAAAEQAVREAASRPFDLAAGPVFRPVLFRLAPDEHVLLLSMHHIVSDGWSLGVLRRELSALYTAHREDRPSDLPQPPLQYADFARWQQRRLREPAAIADLRYWTRTLRDAATNLELPTDRPRPPVQSFAGAVATVTLPEESAARLRELGHRHGVTLHMTILAAMQTLLYRYTGQRDISVGVPVAGRTHAELEPLIGFFLNTLVLRTTVDERMTFADLLRRVRENALGAYSHQDIPFELLVDELDVPRDLGRNPLFQVMVNLLNLPREELLMPGLQATQLPVDLHTSQVDLALYAYERGAGIEFRLEYDTALFDAATVQRMLGHLHTLVMAVTADPTVRLDDVDVLTEPELHRQLVEWNTTGEEASDTGSDPATTVAELIWAQVARTPDRVAVTWAGGSLTYRELADRAERLAAELRETGVGPEVLVAVALERSESLLVTLLAVLRAGGAYLPLDPMYPAERQAYIIDHSGARVLITQRSLAERYQDFGGTIVVVDADSRADRQAGTPAPPFTAQPQHAAYVLYTSGSTGRPKGVRVPHGAVVNLLRAMCRQPGLSESDTLVAVTTVAFDISVLELFGPLVVGARVVIAGRDDALDAQRLARLLDTERATVLQATPATWRLLLDSGWAGSPGLTALCGGEALPVPLANELAARVGFLWNLYGPTEATVWSTVEHVAAGAASVTIGQPIARTRAYVLDQTMRPVPVGIAGELYLGGAGLARDYLSAPGLTAQRFVPDPFGPPGGRLYRTGDLVRYRADGAIEFLGRNDSQVKIRGFRIELGEIEALLQEHPAVRQAAAVVRDDDGEPSIAAYLTARDGAASAGADPAHWRAYLRRSLPEYLMPAAFVVLDRLPLTPNGKLDRRALPAPASAHRAAASGPATPPRTELERTLAATWSEVLRLPAIGIDDDFFDLGGDSFKAVRAVRGLGGSAGVLDIFRYPTIRALAQHIDGAAGDDGGPDGRRRRLLHRLSPPRELGSAVLTLICTPFAGGGAITYQPLAAAAPANIAVYALEPPGHDVNRPDEPVLTLPELARRCVEEIKETITGPIAIYGHCMGGATAVALARQLEAEGIDLVRVFVGGHFPAPRLPGRFFGWLRRMFPLERWTSKRQALEFLRAVGFFTESLEPHERDFIMRVFLKDTTHGEDFYTQAYQDGGWRRLRAPIVCVVGDADRVTELYQDRYLEWEYFSDQISLEVIPRAGHYFQKHQAAELGAIIDAHYDQWRAATEAVSDAPATVPAAIPRGRRQATTAPAASPAPVAVPQTPRPRAGTGGRLSTFFLVAAGQFVSLVGTGLTTFAMGVWVYQRTGSVTLFAMLSVLALLPAVVLAPIAGAVADRWNRRTIMALADSLAGCGTLTLAVLLWTHQIALWHIYAIVSVNAIANAFQQPAYLAAITQLVPKRYYGKANGITQLGTGAGTVLAPLLGGALVLAIGLPGIVLIDLTTFLFAIAVILCVRFPESLFKKREEPFLREILGGWRYLTRRHGLVAIIAFTAVLNFMFGMTEVLAVPLTLSLGTPAVLGLVLAASGAGLLLGSAVMSVWGGTQRRVTGILACFVGIGVAMVVIGVRPVPVFPAIGLFGMGLATAILNAHWLSIVQTKVGLELQGRVIATTLMMSWVMVPAGFLSAGPLAERVFEPLMARGGALSGVVGPLIGAGPGRGMALLVIFAGVATMLLGLAAYRYRPVRLLEDQLPDAIADAVIVSDKDQLQELADLRLATATSPGRNR